MELHAARVAQGPGRLQEYVQDHLRSVSEEERVLWWEALMRIDQVQEDMELLLQCSRWALKYIPPSIASTVLLWVCTLAEQCTKLTQAHVLTKALAIKTVADAIRSGTPPHPYASFIATSVLLDALRSSDAAFEIDPSVSSQSSKLILRQCTELADALVATGIVDMVLEPELLSSVLKLIRHSYQMQGTSKLDPFDLLYCLSVDISSRTAPRTADWCDVVSGLSSVGCAIVSAVRSGITHDTFAKTVEGSLQLARVTATDHQAYTVISDELLNCLVRAVEEQGLDPLSAKTQVECFLGCLQIALETACERVIADKFSTVLTLLGNMPERLKLALKANSSEDKSLQRRACASIRRQCIECARTIIRRCPRVAAGIPEAVLPLATTLLNSPLVLSQFACTAAALHENDVVDRCVDHLSRAMAKAEKYDVVALNDVILAVQELAQASRACSCTRMLQDKHQCLRLVLFCYCVKTRKDFKISCIVCLAECLRTYTQLRISPSSSSEAKEFISNFALRVLDDIIAMHRAVCGEGARAQVERFDEVDHDTLIHLAQCSKKFFEYLLSAILPSVNRSDDPRGVALSTVVREHTIEQFVQFERYAREVLLRENGVRLDDEVELLCVLCDTLAALTLVLWSGMRSLTDRIAETLRVLCACCVCEGQGLLYDAARDGVLLVLRHVCDAAILQDECEGFAAQYTRLQSLTDASLSAHGPGKDLHLLQEEIQQLLSLFSR